MQPGSAAAVELRRAALRVATPRAPAASRAGGGSGETPMREALGTWQPSNGMQSQLTPRIDWDPSQPRQAGARAAVPPTSWEPSCSQMQSQVAEAPGRGAGAGSPAAEPSAEGSGEASDGHDTAAGGSSATVLLVQRVLEELCKLGQPRPAVAAAMRDVQGRLPGWAQLAPDQLLSHVLSTLRGQPGD